jgi:membrane-associated phospholipid phosphatase
MRFLLKPADQLSLLFILLLSGCTMFAALPLGSRLRLLATYSLLAIAAVSLALLRNRLRTEQQSFYLHVLLTTVTILIIFNSMGDLIRGLRSQTYDEMLIRIDHLLFGVHPTVWLEQFITPARTALFQFAYSSYYFIPFALGIVLIVKGRYAVFEEALFGIVLCFYLSYVGYLLVPAIGPRFTLDHLQTAGLQAGPFINGIQETLNGLEQNKTDAFPSGHTAVTLLTLFYAGKLKEKKLFRVLLPLVSMLIAATVYLRYHYVIDVIAGVLLTGLVIVLAPIAYKALSASGRPAHEERHGGARKDGN